MPDSKICLACEKSSPATAEYFYRDRERFQTKCKLCVKASRSAYYVANRAEMRASGRAYYAAHTKEKKAYGVEYRATHSKEKRTWYRRRRRAAHPLIVVWENMVQRCENKNAPNYPQYGLLGVTICAGWRNFQDFENDMSPRPAGTSMGRFLDSNHYSCGHCEECIANGWLRNVEWQTKAQQMAERRGKNVRLVFRRVMMNRGKKLLTASLVQECPRHAA